MPEPITESRRAKRIPVDLGQPLVLTVHSPNGDVSIRAVDRPDVLIEHTAYGNAEEPGDDEAALTIEAHDNRIDVRANPLIPGGWVGMAGEIDLESVVGQISKAFRFAGPFFASKTGKARVACSHTWPDIAIEAPRSMAGRVEVHAASGDVWVEDCTGEIALTTMSGDLRAVRTGGNLALQTASGDLIVEGARGRLTARTASGDVRIDSARLDGFEMQTANGDILVDATLTGDGPFRAQTASGDVRLTLRRSVAEGEEPAATLAFHSVSGDARVAPPFRQIDRRRWRSGRGEQGPRIEITTVNGDLSAEIAATERAFVTSSGPVIHADDAPTGEPMPAAPADWSRGEQQPAVADAMPEAMQPTAPGSASRLAVLEAVERGEIDVEEALRRLDGADASPGP